MHETSQHIEAAAVQAQQMCRRRDRESGGELLVDVVRCDHRREQGDPDEHDEPTEADDGLTVAGDQPAQGACLASWWRGISQH